jgi:hypothetical protein
MDAQAVSAIRREMDRARTSKRARQAMARVALALANLTPCGRAEWLKELA